MSLSDRTVARHEALLRLADGEDGRLVAPNEFLPAAERHGLIGEIDRWVLERVISLLAGHEGAELARRRGGRQHLRALGQRRRGWPASWSGCSTAMGWSRRCWCSRSPRPPPIPDLARARSFCAAMLELGCEIALDDFGAGYGGLHLLRELPFSYLKIDGEFVRRLPTSRADRRSWPPSGSSRGEWPARRWPSASADRRTIAILQEIGVELAQGFELGRPAPLLAAAA